MKLQTFLNRQIGNGADSVILYRAQPNGQTGAKLERFRLEANTDPEGTASEIESVAQGDADTLGQRSSYILRAMRQQEQLGQHSLVITPEDDGEGQPAIEPASRDGLVAQLMRHNEALMRTNLAAMQELASVTSRQGDMFAGVIDTMRTGWNQGLAAQAELATKTAENETKTQIEIARLELDLKSQERKDKLLKDALELLGPMAPVLLQKLLPAEVPSKDEGPKSGN